MQLLRGDRGDTSSTSSRSYGGFGASEPRLFEFSERGRSVAPRCIEMSKQHPEEFLNYLQQAWKRDKIYAKENPDSMFDIKAIRVLCQDGKFRPLGNSYIPLPKLHYLRNRYMLEGEPFPFLRLEPPIRAEGGFGQWRCLRAFAKYHDDLDFFLEMLVRIRRTKASTVEFPRRILELYLRIQAECEDSKDPAASQQKVRNTFEKEQLVYVHPIWRPLSECLLEDTCEISSTLSKSPVFPVPSDWDASKSELVSLREFYTQTLRLQNASYRTIVDVLEKRDFDAELDPADLWLTDELYRALDKMRLDLSPDDAADLKLAFAEKAIIAIAPGEAVTWLNAADCTWSPKLENPEINDLSKHYPELHDFFVNFLDVKQNDSGLIFDTLMNVSSLSPDCSRDNTARGLLVAVSQRIPEFGHIFDKERFARSNVFPVSTADGVLLCASTMEFSVADRQNLKEAFTGKLNLLDFDPKTVWMLDNLLVWAGLDSRYLSKHVEDQGPADENFKSIELPYELSSKADQLLRIAVHFKSPRTTTPKATSWLRETLEHSEVRLASGFQSQLIYRSGSAFITAVNPMGGLDIKDTVGFTVYADDENWEILKQTVLPRRLLEWIMTDPETNTVGSVSEQAVSLVRSILNIPVGREHVIPKILDAEGIVDLELLEASPYWRVNSERVPDTTITTKSDKLRSAKTLDDEDDDEPSPAYTQGESYHAREGLADSKTTYATPGTTTYAATTTYGEQTGKVNGMTTKAGDLTKDTKQDALRDRLPISKRGLERRHSEKSAWEEEFVANEATLIDFSGEDDGPVFSCSLRLPSALWSLNSLLPHLLICILTPASSPLTFIFPIKSHNKQHQKRNSIMVGISLTSCPGFAKKFQDDMEREKENPEYLNNPTMQRIISTISKNFAEVTKDMSVLLANNLAVSVQGNLRRMSSSVAAHITLCSAYKTLDLIQWDPRVKRIDYPAWFFLACVYGPDHEELRPYRDYKSEEEQELLFIASSLADRAEPEDETEDEESDTEDHESSAPPPISELKKMENRLANVEAHFLVIRNQLKFQSELIEEGIKAVREMAESLKAEEGQRELSREEAEVEIASYELVARGVKFDDGAVEDEVTE
ncbi:hypothetical protein FNAPI_6750 [Fusarium napiforme]|uniref:Uncharacterized protein n=1 Tax=Fusarium napiforme TaxID=42672 RepID=A0A8H5JFY6_9HYPO|nr:hypothetical protein FNAPI_6750 [Fusarium napiforme]